MSQLKSAEVAQTILAQLGNNRFIVMTGAKDMSHGTDADGQSCLSMRVGGNSRGVTHVRVTLCHDDRSDKQTAARRLLGALARDEHEYVRACASGYLARLSLT